MVDDYDDWDDHEETKYSEDDADALADCPPHVVVLCGNCGYDVCTGCDTHFDDDGEEYSECPKPDGCFRA